MVLNRMFANMAAYVHVYNHTWIPVGPFFLAATCTSIAMTYSHKLNQSAKYPASSMTLREGMHCILKFAINVSKVPWHHSGCIPESRYSGPSGFLLEARIFSEAANYFNPAT